MANMRQCAIMRQNRYYSTDQDVDRAVAVFQTGGEIMDIAGLSMSMATLDVQSQVGIKMLSKAIDMGEDLGAGMVQMIDAAAMERSVNPAVGGNVDIRL